ncbi:MAG: hypothetical protein WC465_01080 [Patescibacteria group bacterium]
MITFSRAQHISGQTIIAAIIIANQCWLHNMWLGLIFGLIYLWLNSKKLADILFHDTHQGLKNSLGLIVILAYISLCYTLAYHFYQINYWIFLWVFLTIPIIVEILSFFKFRKEHYFFNNLDLNQWKLAKIRHWLWPTLTLTFDILLVILLFKKASLGVVRSPWELVNYKFWILFALSNIALTITILNKKSSKNIFLLCCHFLLISSIAIILYPLGYGYDSFIHAAVLDIVQKTGTIQPRLFLYVGQYGLTLFSQELWQIPLETANKILLPLLFSLLWPISLYYGLRHGFHWSYRSSYLGVLWSLFVGFGFAIMTTPQSLGLLLLATVIFLLPTIKNKNLPLYFIWIVTVMALTIHPLAGIPLAYLGLILVIEKVNKSRLSRTIILTLVYILAALSLPFFLAIYQIFNKIPYWQVLTTHFWPEITWPSLHWQQSYSFPLDMLHNIGQNQIWLYIIIVLIGLILIIRNHKYIFFQKNVIFSLLLLANYLLSKIFINFNLQIAYQKDDYPNRIIYLVALSALPIFLTAVYFVLHRAVKDKPNFFHTLWLAGLSTVVVMISTYFSYPIYDKNLNSKSFNVTATDIKTVKTIEQDANGQAYVVLANQMVGAAAIKEFGFAHYYNDNFYYSMPLGANNIYQEFLSMIEVRADRATAISAMDKTGVNLAYFVVNNYWHSAKTANQMAEQTADQVLTIDGGVNQVFIYKK